MSTDRERTGIPNACLKSEGCQGQTGQPLQLVHRFGGIRGDGRLEREARVAREICLCGENASMGCTTSRRGKAFSARAGVSGPSGSLDALESGVERRRSCCAEESERETEQGDGLKGTVTTALTEVVAGVRRLRRALCQQAKSKKDRHHTWSMPAHEPNRRTASERGFREIRPSGWTKARRAR